MIYVTSLAWYLVGIEGTQFVDLEKLATLVMMKLELEYHLSISINLFFK